MFFVSNYIIYFLTTSQTLFYSNHSKLFKLSNMAYFVWNDNLIKICLITFFLNLTCLRVLISSFEYLVPCMACVIIWIAKNQIHPCGDCDCRVILGNPLRCNCNVRWLQRLQEEGSSKLGAEGRQVRCLEPTSSSPKLLSAVDIPDCGML